MIVKFRVHVSLLVHHPVGDPVHPWASLGDQYCDLHREIYHFEFYPLNGKCEGDPIKLEIPTDGGCKLGVKVYHCREQMCFPEEVGDEGVIFEDEQWLELVQQNYELKLLEHLSTVE